MKKFIFFTLFLSLSTMIIGQTILDVPMCKQQKSLWCWAASAEMIDKFHNRDITTSGGTLSTQCQIVDFFLDGLHGSAPRYGIDTDDFPLSVSSECCGTCLCDDSGTPGNFTIPYFYPSYFFNSTYSSVFHKLGYYNTMLKELVFSDIVKEINYCMPLVLGLEYGSGAGEDADSGNHIVVISGYEETSDHQQILHINDPMNFVENSCEIAPISMINLSMIGDDEIVSKIDYLLAGIRPRNKRLCDSCVFKTDPFTSKDSQLSVSSAQLKAFKEDLSYEGLIRKLANEKNYIKMPVNYMRLKASRNIFLRKNYKETDFVIARDTDFYYFNEQKNNILTKQLVKKELKITQVKTGRYPIVFSIQVNRKLIPVNLQEDRSIELQLIRAYGPLYKEYYYIKKDKAEYFFDPKDFEISSGNKIDKPIVPLNPKVLKKELRQNDYLNPKKLNIQSQLEEVRSKVFNK